MHLRIFTKIICIIVFNFMESTLILAISGTSLFRKFGCARVHYTNSILLYIALLFRILYYTCTLGIENRP